MSIDLQIFRICQKSSQEMREEDATQIRWLISKGASVQGRTTSTQNTVLHIAAFKGNFLALQVLFEHSFDVNALNSAHETPLHLAVKNFHVRAAHCLLKHGAYSNALNYDGEPPLFALIHSARERGQVEAKKQTAALLLSYGADPAIQGKEGRRVEEIYAHCIPFIQNFYRCNMAPFIEVHFIPEITRIVLEYLYSSELIRSNS